MADRAIHTLIPCPGGCGANHPPWARYCYGCDDYISDLAEAAAPAKPVQHTPTDHPDPVCVVWPWEILANVNDRVAPTTEHLRRKLRRYKNGRDAMAAIAAQVAQGREPFRGPVRVTFDFYPPPEDREDTQNFEKAGYDALQGPPGIPGIYLNDRQARHRISIDHGVDTKRPRMEVRVEAIVGGEILPETTEGT